MPGGRRRRSGILPRLLLMRTHTRAAAVLPRSGPPRSRPRPSAPFAAAVVAALAAACGGGDAAADPLLHTVTRGDLRILVRERA